MKNLRRMLIGILFGAVGFGGLSVGFSLNNLLTQADTVVVATVRNSNVSAGALNVELVVGRTLKGSAVPGTTVQASLIHQNVVADSDKVSGFNGIISPDSVLGKTGLWFLKESAVLPLMAGDISADALFLPLPAGNLNPTWAYDAGADPKTKIIQEISAAAQDLASAPAIWRLEANRQLVGLGPDQTGAMFNSLLLSSQPAAQAQALATLTRQGTASAIIAIAAM